MTAVSRANGVSWRDVARQIKSPSERELPQCYPRLSAWDRANLSSVNPLTTDLDYSLCNFCRRPYLNSAMSLHVQSCPRNVGDDASVDSGRKRKIDDTADPAKPKRSYSKKERKTGDRPKKERPKPAPKIKAPVDVEKQCGVPLTGGGLCARSLTCKTHSMGAKRAVVGRSAPYDQLLAQYQRKNQVKMASLSTAQQLADENEALGGLGPIDPEEEVAQVMEGVRRANALPLERKVIFPTRVKNQFFRMREMFASALLPKGTSTASGIGGIFGRANAFNPDQPDTLHFIRPPSLQRTAYLNALKQQQHQQRLAQLQAAQRRSQSPKVQQQPPPQPQPPPQNNS